MDKWVAPFISSGVRDLFQPPTFPFFTFIPLEKLFVLDTEGLDEFIDHTGIVLLKVVRR